MGPPTFFFKVFNGFIDVDARCVKLGSGKCFVFRMPSLEEQYSGIKEKIAAGRSGGLSDQEIQQWIDKQVQDALKSGMSQADIDKSLGRR